MQRDLMATVEARRELGPEYDAELVASFCDRIDDTIQRRMDEQLALRRPSGEGGGSVTLISLMKGVSRISRSSCQPSAETH